MKKRILSLLFAVVMVFGMIPVTTITTNATASDERVSEATLPAQDWQMNRGFPNGTDDTLVINSLGSWNGYCDQGEMYVTLDRQVTSFRLFVNNFEISTASMEAGKTYKVDISDISVDGTNTVQVSNVTPVGKTKLVNVCVGYPVVIDGQPADVGMDPAILDRLDTFMESSVKYGFSGGQIAVIKDGKLVKSSAYGFTNGWNADGTQISRNNGNAVTTDTLYDLAENTKMYATIYAIQYLYEQGRLDLNTKIMDIFGYDTYIEATKFVDLYGNKDAANLTTAKEWKTRITVKDLLMHHAGYKADYRYYDNYFNQSTSSVDYSNKNVNVLYAQGRENTFKMVMASPLEYEPGTKTVASSTDYLLLTFVVEKITGKSIDAFLKDIFWEPMDLNRISYNPLSNGFSKNEIAATELNGNKRADLDNLAGNNRDGLTTFNNMRSGVLQGQVHDELAYYSMDGVSGNAGLFANAEDLAKLASVMLTGGYGENHYFTSSTMELFTEAKSTDLAHWGLGWWREGELSRKAYFTIQSSNETIGHQGWTGTLTMIDPEEDLVVVLLTNKKNSPVLANEKGTNDFWSDNTLAGLLNTAVGFVYDSINSSPEAVDAMMHQLSIERTWVAANRGGAYDMNVHLSDAFAMADMVVTNAEKNPNATNIAYAKDAVKIVIDTLAALFDVAEYNKPNQLCADWYDQWSNQLNSRCSKLRASVSYAPTYAMTPVEKDHSEVKGVGSNLKYSSAEGGNQNAVYFPRTSSNRSAAHCYNNSITWFEGFKGQGKVYVSINQAQTGMRIFINGHEVNTSGMLNKTGVFEIDCSDYTVNGRNLFQITDTGYGASRSTILFLAYNPEVITGTPEDVGINPAVFEMIDRIVSNDIEHGFTSAQLAIVKDGVLVETNAWGAANSYHADGTRINEGDADYEAVTDSTLYDLSHNTKMYSVNYALQKLVSENKINLSDKVIKFFPEFATSTIYKSGTTAAQKTQIQSWKESLTIRNLLEHQSGFNPDPQYHNNKFNQLTQQPDQSVSNELYSQKRTTTKSMVLATPLTFAPGSRTIYSDVDYMLLTFIIEEVSGQGIEDYLEENFWGPMALDYITYKPINNGFARTEIAATELNGNSRDGVVSFANNRTGVIQGTVHDEKAFYSMGGISGHAGLFANATDLAKLAQVMQNYNGYGQTKLVSYEINRYFAGRKDALAQWGLGWWRQGNYQRPWYFGQQAPSTTIGHQGWTGTLTSIDTENNLTTVYLTNKINSPVTDNTSNTSKFDGNWYTASSLGFVPSIIYLGMEEFSATDDIQPALDALLLDMAVIKMNRVVGNGTTDINHPNLLSAYAIAEAAAEMVSDRPTDANKASFDIVFESMLRKYTEAELDDLTALVHSTVFVGGVEMKDNTYLANGATTTTTTQPSGGYAYFKDNNLTLNNYEYEGVGYKYGSYHALIYAEAPLNIILKGSNSLTQTDGYSDCISCKDVVRVSGTGSLTSFGGWGSIYSDSNVTIESGYITVSGAIGLGSGQSVFINGGTINVTSRLNCIYTDNLIINDGVLDLVNTDDDGDSLDYAIGSNHITISAGITVLAATEPNGTFVTYNSADNKTYDHVKIGPVSTNIIVNCIGSIDHIVSGQTVTVSHNLACKVGYLSGGSYVAITAVKNSNDTYSFTAPAGVTEVVLLVKGDVSGDGKINVGDTAKLYSHVRGTAKLTDPIAIFAADVSGDGKLNVGDTAKIYSHVKGTALLTW